MNYFEPTCRNSDKVHSGESIEWGAWVRLIAHRCIVDEAWVVPIVLCGCAATKFSALVVLVDIGSPELDDFVVIVSVVYTSGAGKAATT